MGLKELITSYDKHGCKPKSNDKDLYIKLCNEVSETLVKLNSILDKCGLEKCNDVNYRYIKKSAIPKEYRDEVGKYVGRLRRLNYQLRVSKRGSLLDLDIGTDKIGKKFLRCNFLSSENKNVLLKNCVEEKDYLFTLSFICFEPHLLFNHSELSNFFGHNLINNVNEYLKDNGVLVSNRDINMYLMLRSWDENYKTEGMYLDNKDVLDKIDSVLYEITRGVHLLSYNNPKTRSTDILFSLLFDENPNEVSLYYYDYDSITFKVKGSTDIEKFIEDIKGKISVQDIDYIPYRYIVGKSLLQNLNNIESNGILVDKYSKGLKESEQFDS